MLNEEVNIYVLESDELFLKIITRTLTDIICDRKINLHTFTDGFEFISSIKERGKNSIYIVNDVLPKKNGIEVTKHIRSFDSESIIYFITHADTEEDMIYALSLGVDNYFVKPFNLNIFQMIIKQRILKGISV